jgi:hypothetical protein
MNGDHDMPKIDISESAFLYLKSLAEPLTDTTVTVLDRIIAEHLCGATSNQGVSKGIEMRFGIDDLPSVKFTSIISAKVADKPVSQKYWNNILEHLISSCVATGAEAEQVRASLQANTTDGNQYENGYRFVPSAGFSFQGLEANRVCRNIAILAGRYGVSVDIAVRWQDNEKAAFPNREARLVMP